MKKAGLTLAEVLGAGDAAEQSAFIETASRLILAAPEVRPSASLRDRLLSGIRETKRAGAKEELQEELPGMFVLRAGEGAWRSTPFKGVTFKQVYFDAATSMATSLLRLEPGAEYPAHRHAAVEQCMVLEGDVELGPLQLKAGDYERAAAGSEHGAVRSRGGCLLLIVASSHDELLV